MKKKLLSLLLIVAMAVTLVACGTGEKPSKDNDDNKKPTNTVADATDAPSTEAPVTPYEPGASGPTNATTETPEPEKNVISLLSADGSKVIHEFAIPKGYTVTSDKKSNHVVLAKDGDDTITVELISGPCAEVLSAEYQYIPVEEDLARHERMERADAAFGYSCGGTYAIQYAIGTESPTSEELKNILDEKIDKLCLATGIDKKYFTQPVDRIRVINQNEYYGFTTVVKCPEQYSAEPIHDTSIESPWRSNNYYYWDLSKHTAYSEYPITSYSYYLGKPSEYLGKDPAYVPANETFTIKINNAFNETAFDATNRYYKNESIEVKICAYIDNACEHVNIKKFLNDNFDMTEHTCEYCK